MDDGELDLLNREVFSGSNMEEFPSSGSMDSFFDDLLLDSHADTRACMHTHTCNPPGPDLSHTHTCFHVHTKVLSGPSDDKVGSDDTAESAGKKSKKRPLGNREAVRKYREKKKTRAASLEDEVVRLRAVNQQLLKRLQGQAVLEAEISRLKCLLVDIRGRIEGEIGSFPYQKPINPNPSNTNMSDSYAVNPCSVQCNDRVYCLHPGGDSKSGGDTTVNGQALSGCEFENQQCLDNHNSLVCTNGDVDPGVNPSSKSKRKGGTLVAMAGL